MDRVENAAPEAWQARRRRLEDEAAMIAQGLESIRAGRTVASERVDAWIDSLGSVNPLPAPKSGR